MSPAAPTGCLGEAAAPTLTLPIITERAACQQSCHIIPNVLQKPPVAFWCFAADADNRTTWLRIAAYFYNPRFRTFNFLSFSTLILSHNLDALPSVFSWSDLTQGTIQESILDGRFERVQEPNRGGESPDAAVGSLFLQEK